MPKPNLPTACNVCGRPLPEGAIARMLAFLRQAIPCALCEGSGSRDGAACADCEGSGVDPTAEIVSNELICPPCQQKRALQAARN